METISLDEKYLEDILDLEEEMYWRGERWRTLWQEEAKEKFRALISDYLTNFPRGCLGLIENDVLLGSIFLLKIGSVKTIPYFHKVSDYLDPEGTVAYVSLFVVKRGSREKEIAQQLYDDAEKLAITKLRCQTIEAVIYSSPLEKEILEGNIYEKVDGDFLWEIYPGKEVACSIYCSDLLLKNS